MITVPDTSPEPEVGLNLDEADDLARLLGYVEDWLRHSDADTHDNLTDFFNGPGHGRLAVAGLIDLLATHAATISRRLKQATH
jgi:hypothetical protein